MQPTVPQPVIAPDPQGAMVTAELTPLGSEIPTMFPGDCSQGFGLQMSVLQASVKIRLSAGLTAPTSLPSS